MKTLISCADKMLSEGLGEMLARDGHLVIRAMDGLCAIEAYWRDKPEMVFLSAALPVVDGLTVLRRLRGSCDHPTVIAIAAKMGDRALLEMVAAGADDYLALPTTPDDLRARMLTAGIRRGRPVPRDKLHLEDVVLDLHQRQAWRSGRPLRLTGQEFNLLQVLAEQPHRVVSRAEIGRRLHGKVPVADQRSIEIAVSRLRRKLEEPDRPTLIHTIRQSGYLIGYGSVPRKNPDPPVFLEGDAAGTLTAAWHFGAQPAISPG